MITKPIIKRLIDHRLKDARVLLQKERYHASIYMSGYAIELTMKYKICDLYNFTHGFPESQSEFRTYGAVHNTITNQTVNDVRDIRNHNLTSLLFYSGQQYKITLHFYNEWMTIKDWNPEMRYKIVLTRRLKAQNIFFAVNKIINAVI